MNFTWRRSGTVTDPEVRAVCDETTADCRVAFSGRITIDSSPGVHALLLRRLQSPNCKNLTVDLYDVEYVDTSGLAMLMELLRTARLIGKALQLSGLREKPRYLLEATGLLHLFREVNRVAQPDDGLPYGGAA